MAGEQEREARGAVTRASAAASAVLALGVLGLFLRLQEYGPESALRKFHQALVVRSARELQRVTQEDVRSPDVQSLAALAQFYLQQGGNRYRILRADRTPNEVRAVVAYSLPNDRTMSMVWVVDREGRSWKVNAGKTTRVARDAFGQ